MNCPACKEPMVILELNEVEIDHCFLCGGIWLDAGELELLINGGKEKENFLSAFRVEVNTGEKKRKCPICRKNMEKVSAGAGNVIIDKCRRNDGIWFDAGELEKIMKTGGLDSRVLNQIKEIFQG